jgi:hypothetical protein
LRRRIAIELLGFLTVRQPLLLELTAIAVHKCYLLEARVVIASLYLAYNSPMPMLRATCMGRSGFGGRPIAA